MASRVKARTAVESSPPERKTPSGTSDIIHACTESRRVSRTRRARVAASSGAILEPELPVGLDLEAAAADPGDRARRELPDSLEHGRRPGHELVAQVVVHRLEVHGPGDVRVLEDRLDLRAEDQAVLGPRVVERLDPDPVARQQELAADAVPEREREEPAEALHAARAPRLVGVDDDLRVAAPPEAVPERLELPAEPLVVEHLAVVDELDRAVLVRDGLGAGGRQVDDPEAPRDEPDGAILEDGALVGAAVLDHLPHGLEDVRRGRLPGAELEDAGDAAHG